jgi:chloramphenicol-sensitive protein RarD
VPPSQSPELKTGVGIVYALAAYGLWGILPLYFLYLSPSGALEIVAWRIVLGLVFCVFLLTVTRAWRPFFALARDSRVLGMMSMAAAFILVNWLVYVFATLNGHVVEAALGYFTNPIVTVLLGVLVLRERLRPLQWVSVGISAIAVLVLAINYGAFPWIALLLAFTFGLYGLVKKRAGNRVDAVAGLTIETALLAPVALVGLLVLGFTTGLTMGAVSLPHTIALLLAGAVTAVPLLFFAAAARRVPLTVLGLTQYVAPILQFLIGVFVMGEDMPAARWVGFGLVWLALVVLTIDMFAGPRRIRRTPLEPR